MMNEWIYAGAFYGLAALTLLSAAGVVFLKDIVHSALLLAASFIGVAGIYVLLNADFLAAVQVLVYGGAVAILIAFGVMLTRRPHMKETNANNRWVVWGAFTAAFTFAICGWAIAFTPFMPIDASPAQVTAIDGIATQLLGDFVVPFEAAAILLTVALIGAIILAKGAKEA
ncbi:proton-translocating NADH-ubiquinone oxidoreductase, chain j [Heliomicrobium modesticaldum Ice1]|uniref:NADH-quinone oxidoreductase subunit J n=1 Tax=Heliobacterium modesticaldum (strain ATCC 51547 / Ice1) TaxID=498761 RepID=B0TH83_HELMI|nr:NADH-quinone oxidoreductase subunit J [Heliomicrobium modesticaldum]ABZ84758.1 proton-translocating NADH-ubiquinone oxidoreductase, chain j [Heliomicrobium modesticaldum Ice1]